MNKNQVAENIVFLLSDDNETITEPIFDLLVELIETKFGKASGNYLRENTVMATDMFGDPFFKIDEDTEQLDAFVSEMKRAK